MKQLARFIDDHIDVVKSGASSAFIANKIMNQKDRYNKFYDLGKNYYMAEGIKESKNNKSDNTTYSSSDKLQFDNTTLLGYSKCIQLEFHLSVIQVSRIKSGSLNIVSLTKIVSLFSKCSNSY